MSEKASQNRVAGYAERDEIALGVVSPVTISMVDVQRNVVLATSAAGAPIAHQDAMPDGGPALQPRRIFGRSSFLTFPVLTSNDSSQVEVVSTQIGSILDKRAGAFTGRAAFGFFRCHSVRLCKVVAICTASWALGVFLSIVNFVAAHASTLRKHDGFSDGVVMEAQLVRRRFYLKETIIRFQNQLPICFRGFGHVAPPIAPSIARK